jgi:hypothetical protein
MKVKIVGPVEGFKDLFHATGQYDEMDAAVLVAQKGDNAVLQTYSKHLSMVGSEVVVAYTGPKVIKAQAKPGAKIDFSGVRVLSRPLGKGEQGIVEQLAKANSQLKDMAQLVTDQSETIANQGEVIVSQSQRLDALEASVSKMNVPTETETPKN